MKHKSHREWPLESWGRVDQTQKCGHYNQKQSQCPRARRTPMCFGGKSDKAESCRRFCITIFLANGSKIFRIQKFSIFEIFREFENSKFWNFRNNYFWNFFGEIKEIWSQDKPRVDENSKAWNGKEFDSEVVGKSIRKSFHQMSAEKRFVTFHNFSWIFQNFDNFDDLAGNSVKSRLWTFLYLLFQQNDYADIIIIALFKLMTDLLTRPSIISSYHLLK